MHKPIVLIPCPQLFIFFHNTDVHFSAARITCPLKRIVEQICAEAMMSTGRQNTKLIQFAYPMRQKMQRIIADDLSVLGKICKHLPVLVIHLLQQTFFCGCESSEPRCIFGGKAKGVCHCLKAGSDDLHTCRNIIFIDCPNHLAAPLSI